MKTKSITVNQKGCQISSVIKVKDEQYLKFDINVFMEVSEVSDDFLITLAKTYQETNSCEIIEISFKIWEVYDWNLKFNEKDTTFVVVNNKFIRK